MNYANPFVHFFSTCLLANVQKRKISLRPCSRVILVAHEFSDDRCLRELHVVKERISPLLTFYSRAPQQSFLGSHAIFRASNRVYQTEFLFHGLGGSTNLLLIAVIADLMSLSL